MARVKYSSLLLMVLEELLMVLSLIMVSVAYFDNLSDKIVDGVSPLVYETYFHEEI